ncbi:MAG: hypothetical protein H0W97_11205 [Actinobacteria bacterium]|nr:hypothetical protein [Actinomycetota bacterium]
MSTRARWSVRNLAPYAVAAASLLLAAMVVASNLETPSTSSPASASPDPRAGATILTADTLDDLPATVRPYPYTEPAPAPVPTEIDGTYMLILTLEELGGANNALPFPCRRCLPYARDPGVTTLIFFQGAYFVDHQMSGFRATGHYEVDGNRLALFNDPNCSRVRGTYTWQLDGRSLRLEAVDDTCAFQGERATDLASDAWTKIPVCKREVQHLWPGILGCRGEGV